MKAMPNGEERLGEGRLAALQSLATAWNEAEAEQIEARQLAVTLSGLCLDGASEADVQWLVAQRLVEPLIEVTREGEIIREFREYRGPNFDERICFVLSYAGSLFLKARGLDKANTGPGDVGFGANGHPRAERVKWDHECHELWVDGKVVKRYTQPAPCHWAILDAFQQSNWPRRVSITLPTNGGRSHGRRLSEVVADLNRRLKGSPVRFFLDGSGCGVLCHLDDRR